MKLRNKKTGEIGNLITICASTRVFVDKKSDKVYNTLAELNAEWEDVPEEEPKEFWYIKPNGCIERDNLGAVERDIPKEYYDKMVEIGNKFETEEETEKAVEKLKALTRLSNKGFKFTGYDSGHNSNKELCGQAYFKAGNFWFDIKADLDLLFGGEE